MMTIQRISFVLVALYGLCNCDQTNVGCDPDWWPSATGQECYYIEKSKSVTRRQAQIDCGNRQADLFRFSDVKELKYIQGVIKDSKFNSDGYWTDLTDLRFDGSMTGTGLWQWGQYLQLDNSTIPWEVYPTPDASESCGAINVQGKFLNMQCSRRLSYICEITVTADQGCPLGWMLTDANRCFFFSDTTNGTQLKTFNQAQQACSAMTGGAHLLTIATPGDVTYLNGQLPYLTANTALYWTGLKRAGTGWAWANNDQFVTQYVNWATEPDHLAGNEHCGIIKTDGKFADQDCKKTFNYICVKGTTIVDSNYFFGCGGWNRAGQKCYMFYDKPKTTYDDANSRCQGMGSRLLKVENKDEKRWLEWQMTMTDTHPSLYWTGLNDRASEGNYRWADNTKADPSLVRWNSEPNDWFGNEDCATIMADGVYNDLDCTGTTGFICEYINLLYNPSSKQPICGPGWINWPNSRECYFFSAANASYSWTEARDYCNNVKIVSTAVPTTLLAVNSAEEQQFIQQQLAKMQNPGKGFWTSLTDKNEEGQWLYVDNFNNPPDPKLINWQGEPSDDGTKNEDCTFLLYGGRYYDTNCKYKFGFICEKYATGFSGNGASATGINYITYLTLLSITALLRHIF